MIRNLTIMISLIYLLIFLYILFLTIWEKIDLKNIEKNKTGMLQSGMDIVLEKRKKKTRSFLFDFTPGEALKYLTDTIIATAAIISLYLSSN